MPWIRRTRCSRRVSLAPYGAGPNSVDARRGLVAVAVEAAPKTDPGAVVFLTPKGDMIARAAVGALPDMLTFTDDGKHVLVANEGKPSGYGGAGADPEGTVSIVSTARLTTPGGPEVRTVGFAAFNAGAIRHGDLLAGLRLNGPGASVAQDLEPEYIALADDGRSATVTLQEANALAHIDLRTARVTRITALGWKDHSVAGAGLDPSDRDGGVHIGPWPVRGLYMPDAIASFRLRGRDYLITANEGDAREWPTVPSGNFADEVRVGASSVVLDPVAFPNAAALKGNAALGRLTISRTDGLIDGRYAALYAFVGLERVGGVMVFDVTDPRAPTQRNRDPRRGVPVGATGRRPPTGGRRPWRGARARRRCARPSGPERP